MNYMQYLVFGVAFALLGLIASMALKGCAT